MVYFILNKFIDGSRFGCFISSEFIEGSRIAESVWFRCSGVGRGKQLTFLVEIRFIYVRFIVI